MPPRVRDTTAHWKCYGILCVKVGPAIVAGDAAKWGLIFRGCLGDAERGDGTFGRDGLRIGTCLEVANATGRGSGEN